MSRTINPLGDLAAETDKEMLDVSFYETPDYKTVVESSEKSIVVGRRGTGKSALCYYLSKHFKALHEATVCVLAPEDFEVTSIRHNLRALGSSYNLAKSASKILTKYALILELVSSRSDHFKFDELEDAPFIRQALKDWKGQGDTFFSRLGMLLNARLKPEFAPEAIVAGLAAVLQIRRVEAFFNDFIKIYNPQFVMLIDRLDEGYEHDTLGIAFLAGLTEVTSQFSISFSKVFHGVVFLRDNIARSIESDDPDFSRTFESHILRLHWGRYELFNMVCNRLRVAFEVSHENSQKVWDSLTAQRLRGSDGFDYCLRLTLYRPRDLLVLLNEAFNCARKHERAHIDESDIESSAKEISNRRLNDLTKEYGKQIWGLNHFISVFANDCAHHTTTSAVTLLDKALTTENLPPAVAQHCAILGSGLEVLRCLYSVGFLGVKSAEGNRYKFCHDGKTTDLDFNAETQLLVHPCYWMALNIVDADIAKEDADQINDEFDELKIEISSIGVEQRQKRLDALLAELPSIPPGEEGASRFEKWCEQALTIVYAGALSNFSLHPNGTAIQRRDVVARNIGTRSAWERILRDYEVRQTIFEIKNYDSDLGPSEFRQMSSYLKGPYGRLGFIVNRSKSMNLESGKELDWVREIWQERKLIIKLNADHLAKMLSRIRNPQKHDEPDNSLNGLLDQYERLYLSLPSTTKARAKE